MATSHHQRIRQQVRPLAPLPTDEPAKLIPLLDTRAVLFDIYGTMLISGCGEVGTEAATDREAALAAAWAALRLSPTVDADAILLQFDAEIRRQHTAARQRGFPYPEVDIRDVWQQVLQQAEVTQLAREQVESLALEYELRVNPVWPMPGLETCLDQLRRRGTHLGIISNAQFFTPLLFPPLLDASVAELGFDAELQFYSYRHGRAKPDNRLFQLARHALENRQVEPSQVLYIGNDMLNDISAAAQAGFRTALFAGDRRSLRWRREDARVAAIQPDIVVRHLDEVCECLG